MTFPGFWKLLWLVSTVAILWVLWLPDFSFYHDWLNAAGTGLASTSAMAWIGTFLLRMKCSKPHCSEQSMLKQRRKNESLAIFAALLLCAGPHSFAWGYSTIMGRVSPPGEITSPLDERIFQLSQRRTVVVKEIQLLMSDDRDIAVDYICTYHLFVWRVHRETRNINFGENALFTQLDLRKAHIDGATLIVPGAEGETELRFDFPKEWQ